MSKYFLPAAASVVLVILLAGCSTKTQLGARDQVYGYSLAAVEVTISDDVYTGVFERMDNVDKEEFAERVKTRLEAVMTESVGPSFSGTQPARMLVHVDEMDIASGAGRAIFGKESYIGGKVDIVDVASNKIIAERHFREREKDVSFGGNLGGLIELTKNIVDAVANDRVDEVAREFAERVKGWLDS